MPFYTKKPVTIEAHKLCLMNRHKVAEWCNGEVRDDDQGIDIITLEGVMTANFGDFVIQGVHGEFCPCKSEIFCETYIDASD